MAKTCITCGLEKPISDYYRHSQMGDGHLNKCIECVKWYARERRIKNPDYIRALDRKRGRRVSAHIPDPEKTSARYAVQQALKNDIIRKGSCVFCRASEGRMEAHHHDYAKPLAVTWMCDACHKRFHALEAMATYTKGDK